MPPRVSDGRSWAAAELEPPVGPATCADPPSFCADWGRHETLQVLVPVLQEKHRQGAPGARRTVQILNWSLLAGNPGTEVDGEPQTLQVHALGTAW